MLPVAARNRCSRTQICWPCCIGSATISPAWLSDSATCPGPRASTMISGSPAIFRFHAPFSGMLVSRVCGSVQSSTWWEK
jgi:hypothetical protein